MDQPIPTLKQSVFYVQGRASCCPLPGRSFLDSYLGNNGSVKNQPRSGYDPEQPANAIWRLGERDSGIERLEEAAEVCHHALKEWTHEPVPLQWPRSRGVWLV
jgi:hypothetical protein